MFPITAVIQEPPGLTIVDVGAPEGWIKFAVLMHEMFDAFDLTHLALVRADPRGSAHGQ